MRFKLPQLDIAAIRQLPNMLCAVVPGGCAVHQAKQLTGHEFKVSQACIAKKTVYFEVKETKVVLAAGEALPANAVVESEAAGAAAGAPTDATARVTAFDAPAANTAVAPAGSKTVTVTVREIVPVEIVPVKLPTDVAISPSTIVKNPTGPGG